MATYRLTSPRTLGHVGHPNCKRRIRRLCHAPHGEKSGLSCILPPVHPFFGMWLHIGKGTSGGP